MSTFQKIIDTTGISRPAGGTAVSGERLLFFTNPEGGILSGSVASYPVTGVDESGNTFSGTMTREPGGGFKVSSLSQTN